MQASSVSELEETAGRSRSSHCLARVDDYVKPYVSCSTTLAGYGDGGVCEACLSDRDEAAVRGGQEGAGRSPRIVRT